LNIPLRGIAIGNGWIDSKEQYLAYLDFAVKVGLLEENSQVFPLRPICQNSCLSHLVVQNWEKVKDEHDKCSTALDKLHTIPMAVRECAGIMRSIMRGKDFKKDGQNMCLNMYDIRLTDISPACGLNWPPEMHAVTAFLDVSPIYLLALLENKTKFFSVLRKRPEVVSALHATAHPGSWVECKHPVHAAFSQHTADASVAVLPKLLSKIRVLVFAGDQDLICNYLGLENMIKKLTWNGGTGLGVSLLPRRIFSFTLNRFFLLVRTNTTVQCGF
jgi:carboxypeptidase D